MRKALIFLITIVAMAAAGVVGRNIANRALPPPQGGLPTEVLLAKAIEKANKNLPTMIDQHTRLDLLTSPLPKVLQYNYTLLNIDTPRTVEFANIERKVREMIVGRACSTPSMGRFLDRGVTNIYSYNAADGAFFGSVTVTRADCRR